MVLFKLSKLKLNNLVHERNKFVRKYNTQIVETSAPKSGKFQKVLVVVSLLGLGGYVYYNELARENQIKEVSEDNQNTIKEIIDTFKGGWEVEELEGEKFSERL